jgi:ADP-heptose:LPS heptosyltransferase
VAFQGVAAAERIANVFRGGTPSLEPSELARIRNFLIPLSHSYLGSAVHETPLIEALRTAMPDANIVAAGSGIAAEVYQHHPGLTRLERVTNPNSDFWASVREYRQIVRSFRGEPWCALFTTWNHRSRVALAMMMAGNGVRAGYAVASSLIHLPLSDDRDRSQIAKNLRLLGLLGHEVPAGLEPRVCFTLPELDHARDLVAGDPNRPIAVLITRTSGGQPTRWPDDRFAAVARHLIESHDCRVVLPGTAQDVAELTRLADHIGEAATSIAGRTSIPQLAAVCALSDIAVAVDTGATHIARAQELPLAIIAPGWQDSIDWMPLGKPWARILKGPWFAPPPPANYAIEEVSVEAVNAVLDELFREYPPSRSSREARVERGLTNEGRVHRNHAGGAH